MPLGIVETPEGPVTIVEPILNALLIEGVVFRAADGTLHAESKQQIREATNKMGICDFCDEPNPHHSFATPAFKLAVIAAKTSKSSATNWWACDACYDLVMHDDREGLFKRAVEAAGVKDIGVFAIQGLHEGFWKAREDLAEAAGIGAVLIDFIDNKVKTGFVSIIPDRQLRIEAVKRLTHITNEEMSYFLKGHFVFGEIVDKLVAWHSKFGSNYEESLDLEVLRQVKPTVQIVPHWQIAIEKKFEVLKLLRVVAASPGLQKSIIGGPGLVKSFHQDLTMLQLADVYSFSAETMYAILEASNSLPHDALLSSIETPGIGQGWFWFAEPLPIQTSDYSHGVSALLWGWYGKEKDLRLRFSVFTVTHDKDLLEPSAEWTWPSDMSFHDMVTYSQIQHRQLYGPGGDFEKVKTFGEEKTIKAIADVSLFFLMCCVWFKQEYITKEKGHVERHARKRVQREYKLIEPPDVRVVSLRKAHRDVIEEAISEEEQKLNPGRTYHYRWIVRGHPKMQAYGPGRKEHKLIWISPYPAGPENLPLKTKKTVYAVVR
jgi:hypothetical protein